MDQVETYPMDGDTQNHFHFSPVTEQEMASIQGGNFWKTLWKGIKYIFSHTSAGYSTEDGFSVTLHG